MQKQLNLKVKYRESFRPFATSVLREDVGEWFEHETDSPYMLLVADVRNDKRRSMAEDEEACWQQPPKDRSPPPDAKDHASRSSTDAASMLKQPEPSSIINAETVRAIAEA